MKKILFATMMACAGAFAADKTWTNGTGDGKWGTPGNWLDNAAPTASDTGYTITVSGTSENNIPGLTPTRLILAGSSAVRVTGESLALTDGVQFDATADATLVVPLVLSGAGQQTFGGSSAKTLYLMGVVSGAGGIELTGAYTLYVAGSNTFEGGFKQSDGRVMIENGNAFGRGGVAFTKPAPLISGVNNNYCQPFIVVKANLTIPNDIAFARDGYTENRHNGSVAVNGGTIFNGVCDFSAGGMRILTHSAPTAGAVTFNKTVKMFSVAATDTDYRKMFLPKINSSYPFEFKARVTGNGLIGQDTGGSVFNSHVSGNEVISIYFWGANTVVNCKARDTFMPTTYVKFKGTNAGGLLNLGGHDQTVACVFDEDSSRTATRTVKGGGTARLTMKAAARSTWPGRTTTRASSSSPTATRTSAATAWATRTRAA